MNKQTKLLLGLGLAAAAAYFLFKKPVVKKPLQVKITDYAKTPPQEIMDYAEMPKEFSFTGNDFFKPQIGYFSKN